MRLRMIFVVLLIACTGSPTDAELVGNYAIQYSYGQETLSLKGGGSYEQVFVSKEGKVLRNSAKWEMRGQTLLLQNAMDVDDGFGNFGDPSKRWDWWLKPERSGHKIVIVVNPDRKERYEKQR